MRKAKSLLIGSVEICSRCGKRILMCGHNETRGHIPYIMQRDWVCFECAYWTELAEFPQKNMEVTGEKCLIINPMVDKAVKKDKSVLLGSKGKKRYFMRTNGTPVISNDVWIIGTIPPLYKSLFKRTVYEIKKSAYQRLERFNRGCNARQCYDRYNCLRYNKLLEVKDGPANTIPKNWKSGAEHCPSFIDKTKYVID